MILSVTVMYDMYTLDADFALSPDRFIHTFK